MILEIEFFNELLTSHNSAMNDMHAQLEYCYDDVVTQQHLHDVYCVLMDNEKRILDVSRYTT